MLIELRRWVYPLHPGAGASRWFAWARALLRRHGRIARSYRLLEMALLVRTVPLTQRLHQQWLLASTQYFPRIHLAIQPLLTRSVWRERMNLARDSGIDGPTHGHKILTKCVSWVPDQGRDMTTQHFNDLTVRESRLATLQTVFRSMGIAPREMGRQPAGGPLTRGRSLNSAGTQLPLRLVFQRLGRTDELVVTPHRNARIPESIETQAHELKRRIRRIEPRPAESASLIVHKATRGQIGQAEASAPMTRQTPVNAMPATFGADTTLWMRGNAPILEASIEQLTDRVVRQLDRRIIAVRERMGRI
ncbi:MAG: hypothetical protein ACREV1_00260 [Gammaproteobacteria bacterium]